MKRLLLPRTGRWLFYCSSLPAAPKTSILSIVTQRPSKPALRGDPKSFCPGRMGRRLCGPGNYEVIPSLYIDLWSQYFIDGGGYDGDRYVLDPRVDHFLPKVLPIRLTCPASRS